MLCGRRALERRRSLFRTFTDLKIQGTSDLRRLAPRALADFLESNFGYRCAQFIEKLPHFVFAGAEFIVRREQLAHVDVGIRNALEFLLVLSGLCAPFVPNTRCTGDIIGYGLTDLVAADQINELKAGELLEQPLVFRRNQARMEHL